MPKQITFYHDSLKLSPWCYMVEIALLEAGASYTSCGLDIHNKPAWFVQGVNPLTGKVPAITYGGPNVPPEEPSPLSFKLTESIVILEFLADLFPDSGLLPPASNPTARARVRSFIDVVIRDLEKPLLEAGRGGGPEAFDKMIEGLAKIQALLPDPDAVDGGEYALGKDFTNADCVVVPLLAFCQLVCRTGLGKFVPGAELKLKEALEGENFERLRRYQRALWERVRVKKVVDLERMEGLWRAMFAGN